jgi:hypothetical protein
MARRRSSRRVDHDKKRKAKSRTKAVKDAHVGAKVHNRTVNAPKGGW